jgi:hypothetical protein
LRASWERFLSKIEGDFGFFEGSALDRMGISIPFGLLTDKGFQQTKGLGSISFYISATLVVKCGKSLNYIVRWPMK